MRSQVVSPSIIIHNAVTVTTAGARVILGRGSCLSVTITALPGNIGVIYVGGNAVSSTNGYQLTKGSSISLDINDLGVIYIDAANDGDSVTYLGIRN